MPVGAVTYRTTGNQRTDAARHRMAGVLAKALPVGLADIFNALKDADERALSPESQRYNVQADDPAPPDGRPLAVAERLRKGAFL